MIVTLISEDKAASAAKIDELVRELDKSRVVYVLVDADSPEGAQLAELYDITRRPAVLVTQDDGVMTHLWQGSLPSADELGYSSRS